MKVIWDGGSFRYESDVLKFFSDERDFPNINSTNKKTKAGKFIFHISIYWYHPGTGEAITINLGRIFLDHEDYIKYQHGNPNVPAFKKGIEDIMKKAEQQHTQLYKQILDKIFGER